MRILIWYRHDLRLHDHEPLAQALAQQAEVIPVYCFDGRQFAQTSFGFPKTGSFRSQFLLESVQNLRQSLIERNSNLVIRVGKPEIVIPEIVEQLNIDQVYFSAEVTAEETRVEQKLQQALSQRQIPCRSFWGATLYHPQDLPFPVSELPELFTHFRKKVEKLSAVRPCFPLPSTLPPLPQALELGEIPSLERLGVKFQAPDSRGVLAFQGGETAGIQRLQDYFWQCDCLKVYKQTRNGMLGENYSSKFSPWLALGCLSPRYIYEEVKKYEQERVQNDSTYWLVFELLWRDFFRLMASKHGVHLFQRSGLRRRTMKWSEDWEIFQKWQEGKTGYPLIDANMRELNLTGFMSNRGRQNVASFLTKNLGINWQLGAEYFESMLIDYDVCSNWGNWNYTAGVGNDARRFRYFNTLKQAKDYDKQGHYVRHWLPELKNVPASKIHQPGQLSPSEQQRFQVKMGIDYPLPMVDFFASIQKQETIYNQGLINS